MIVNAQQDNAQPLEDDELASWVMSHVNKWRDHRDSNYSKKWSEYYRLWRGFWNPEDKNRDSERSRLIAPALQQAVDMTVSEMEEATFGRGVWFDVSDDYEDQQKEDAILARDLLLCDFEREGVPAAISETYTNGALYGQGIAKIMIGKTSDTSIVKGEQGPVTEESERFRVWLEPIGPTNFVIDPGSRSVEDALGCAHEIAVPMHKVKSRMKSGFYFDKEVGPYTDALPGFNESGASLTTATDQSDVVFITEYHGLVPKGLLYPPEDDERLEGEDVQEEVKEIDDELVEAIVTVANKGILLRAVENPYMMKDRAIVTYSHETVPGRFWGRGVSEKGYNPQKALDAELRARIDSLAYLTYPIMGADATRLPRGGDLKVTPGRMILTNGRPSEILEPIVFGNLNPATFQQSGDLERMVQMGTGAMDSASPLETNRRNETVGGMSMIQGGFIKRSKRTMQNVERNFLDKIVQKSLWRYMQFAPERYPQDVKFQVNSTMGIMAREFEQATLTQMLQVVPPESPVFPVVIKGIIENSAAVNKTELLDALKQMMTPNPQAQQMQQMMQELQLRQVQAEVAKLEATAEKEKALALKAMYEAQYTQVKTSLEDDKVEIQAANTVLAHQKNALTAKQIEVNARLQAEKNENDRKKAQQKPKSKTK